MNLSSFIFCTLFMILNCQEVTRQELNKVMELYKSSDQKCIFNHTLINSTTINQFPTCSNVYGILVINANTDITNAQLQNAFSNMRRLYGGIRVENTNFSMINIKSTASLTIFCEYYGVYIMNNPYLYSADFLLSINSKKRNGDRECEVHVVNNPNFDVGELCDQGYLDFVTLKTKENEKDCGCQGDEITSLNLPQYQDCKTLYNGLKLFNITNTSSLSALSNIRTIGGEIDIQNTLIQNLSFLERIRTWDIRTNGSLILNVKNNPEMTRLDFTFSKIMETSYEGPVIIGNFEGLHPDFCVSIKELLSLVDQQFTFNSFHAKVCDDIGNIGKKVLCRFESMYDLPNNCDVILGNLIIDSGDEEDITKLEEIALIVGSLIIRNTNLKTFESISSLFDIVHLEDDHPAIQITGNKILKNILLTGFQSLITRGNRDVLVQDNNPATFNSNKSCELIDEFYGNVNRINRTRVQFIGADCGERVEAISSSGSTFLFLISLIISIYKAQLS